MNATLQPPARSRYHASLATTCSDLGDFAGELLHREKSLAIQVKVLPDEHPSLALGHGNLGIAYSNLGRHADALTHQQAAHKIFIAVRSARVALPWGAALSRTARVVLGQYWGGTKAARGRL